MKRPVYVIILSALLLAGGIPAYADMGIPDEPRYTVAIDIYGADYYYDWDSMDYGSPDGSYAGGQKFYVWAEYGEGRIQGTTNPKASSDDFDSMPYIYSSDTMRESERVSPDVGDRTEDTVYAATTDKLNLRTGPGTGFKVLKVLDNGANVEYDYTFRTDTVWMYVRADGLEGWVSGDYLRTKKVGTNTEDNANEEAIDNTADTQIGDEASDNETALKVESPETNAAEDKKKLVAGIILICLGSAILIAVLAIYLLSIKKNEKA